MRISLAISAWACGVIVATTVSTFPCAARETQPPLPETGYPSYLINRPTCAPIELFDDQDCRRAGWPLARGRPRID